MTDELISNLKEMNSILKGLAEEFRECSYYDIPRLEELTSQYRECLAKHVPEVAELLERLKLMPAISLRDADLNPALTRVYDVEMQKDIIIAANPRSYEDLKSFIEWLIEYVDNPEEGEAKDAQWRLAPKLKTKWKLEMSVRKWAEPCLIDDDDTLSLIKKTLVHEEGDLKSLDDAVFEVIHLIRAGFLVLGGNPTKQMMALVKVFHSRNVTLPPDTEAWAERKGLIPLSQKTQVSNILAQDIGNAAESSLKGGDEEPSVVQRESGLARESGEAEPMGSLSKKNSHWIICFEDERWVGKNTKKARQLVALIKLQGTPVEALALVGVDKEGRIPEPTEGISVGEHAPEISDSMPHMRGRKAGAIGDFQAIHELRHELKEQESYLESDNIHEQERAIVEEEIDQLKRELDRLISIHGNLREMSGPTNKAARSVKHNLRELIKSIEPGCPNFAAHLEDSLSFGRVVSYAPSPAVLWTF